MRKMNRASATVEKNKTTETRQENSNDCLRQMTVISAVRVLTSSEPLDTVSAKPWGSSDPQLRRLLQGSAALVLYLYYSRVVRGDATNKSAASLGLRLKRSPAERSFESSPGLGW